VAPHARSGNRTDNEEARTAKRERERGRKEGREKPRPRPSTREEGVGGAGLSRQASLSNWGKSVKFGEREGGVLSLGATGTKEGESVREGRKEVCVAN
jgi:hypothetical protein